MTVEHKATWLYKLVFYAGGLIFAVISYLTGVYIFGAESANMGKSNEFFNFTSNLAYTFDHHMLSFVFWMTACTAISITIGYLFDREILNREKAEQRASIDGLTELYNHRFFQDRLKNEIERSIRSGKPLSLIIVDLDYFKNFNDTWGHQEGDRLLKWFADVCKRSIRSIDIPARYGGEEFAIILPETCVTDALDVAERIRNTTISESIEFLGNNKKITVSAGVASYPDLADDRYKLVLNADAALYLAKKTGRNRCLVFKEGCGHTYHIPSVHVKPMEIIDEDLETIKALGTAIDSHDVHMKGHSANVMRISVAIASKMGLSAEEIDNIRVAALLHDIGKVAIPEDLLEKPEPLVSKEWRLIQSHSKLGAALLGRVQHMTSIIPGIKHHHERYDGKGYPYGLKGTNIPILARIISIADAYDAMTSARIYRTNIKSHAEALNEIKRCSGSQFDPELVEDFFKTMEDKSKKSKAA